MSDDTACNYYQLLHVQPDAPPEVIKASYRVIMQKMKIHPDLGGDKNLAAGVNQAYETLSDPVRREAYDREAGFNYERRKAQPQPTPHGSTSDPIDATSGAAATAGNRRKGSLVNQYV